MAQQDNPNTGATPNSQENPQPQPGPAPSAAPYSNPVGVSAPLGTNGRYDFSNPYYNTVASSPEGAWALLQSYLFGPPKRGGGPFDKLMDAFLKPLAFAIAQAGGIGGGNYDLGQIFDDFGNAIQGTGGGFNQYAGKLTDNLMSSIGNGKAMSYDELVPRLTAAGALKSATMNPLAGQSWLNDLDYSIGNLRQQNLINPGAMYQGDWGKYFSDTPFYKDYVAQMGGTR